MNKKTESRINRTIGQLEALKVVLSSSDYDCEKVIQLVKAITGSTKSLGRFIAEEEIQKCMGMDISEEAKKKRINSIISASF